MTVNHLHSSTQDLATEIEHFIQREIAVGFAGAVLIQHETEILVDKAYGSLKGVEVNPGQRFCIASLGKQFTSTAILKCQELGLLSLNAPISQYIPDVPRDKRSITVLHLLAHTSGWPQNYAGENHADRDAAVAAILVQPLVSEPGRDFHYCNDNYQLAAAIIELVSGMTYQDFVQTRLFTPARLENTGQLDANSVLQLAPALEPFPARFFNPTWGQEGFYSSASDLFRWYEALRGGQVLKKEWVNKLFEPVVPIREGASALGWFIGETEYGVKRIFSRGNEDFGANSLFYAYPACDSVIVILTHAGDKHDGNSYSRVIHHWIEKRMM